MLTRRNVVLAAVVAALLGLLAATRTWVSGVVVDPVLGSSTVGAAGTALAPALLPVALAALLGALAASIARGMIRAACGVLVALAGAATVALTVRVLSGPTEAFAALRRDSLSNPGVGGDTVGTPSAGSNLHSGVVDTATLQAWPWVALLAGAILGGCGLVIAVRGRRWATAGKRYDRGSRDGTVPGAASDPDRPDGPDGAVEAADRRPEPGADWDRLSLGEDPTDPSAGAAVRREKPTA